MSTATDIRKSVRVIAFNAVNVHHLKTVNILTSRPGSDSAHAIPEFLQLTAAQAASPHHATVMDSGGGKAGLKTIVINGYAGPN